MINEGSELGLGRRPSRRKWRRMGSTAGGRATLMAFSRTHHVKGALLVTHSGQQTRQRDDEYQHNNWVRHISSLRTLIRTSEPNFTALEAMLGGEAVWIDQLPPLLREPLPATAPRQRLRREPIITCFGHALSHCRSGSRLRRASADRKRTCVPYRRARSRPERR